MKSKRRKFIIGSAAVLLALALSGQARAATLWFYNITNNIGRIEINQRGPYNWKASAEAAAKFDRQAGLQVSPVFGVEDVATELKGNPAPASPPADNAPAVAANQKPANQTDGPSEQETIDWIQKHIFANHNKETSTPTTDSLFQQETVVGFEVQNGQLQIAIESQSNERSSNISEYESSMRAESVKYSVYRVMLKDLFLGGGTYTTRQGLEKYPVSGMTLISEFGSTMFFGSKENAVQMSTFSFSHQVDYFKNPFSIQNTYDKNGGEVVDYVFTATKNVYDSWRKDSNESARFTIPYGLEWESVKKTSGISFPIQEGMDERMKKAFNHLIELSGGGKPPEAPKEAF